MSFHGFWTSDNSINHCDWRPNEGTAHSRPSPTTGALLTFHGLHHQALTVALDSGDRQKAHAVLDAYAHDHAIAVASHACLGALVAEMDRYLDTVRPQDRTPALRQLVGSIPLRHARNLTEDQSGSRLAS